MTSLSLLAGRTVPDEKRYDIKCHINELGYLFIYTIFIEGDKIS